MGTAIAPSPTHKPEEGRQRRKPLCSYCLVWPRVPLVWYGRAYRLFGMAACTAKRLSLKAQGCDEGATLGSLSPFHTNPNGIASTGSINFPDGITRSTMIAPGRALPQESKQSNAREPPALPASLSTLNLKLHRSSLRNQRQGSQSRPRRRKDRVAHRRSQTDNRSFTRTF